MISIKNLMSAAMLLSFLILFIFDYWIGTCYALGVTPIILFMNLYRKSPPLILGPIYVGCLALYVFYFIRPVLLVIRPDLFGYYQIGIPNNAILAEALLLQGYYTFFFLAGLGLTLRLFRRTLSLPLDAMPVGIIERLGGHFVLLITLLSLVWFAIIFGLNVAQKSTDSQVEVLRLLLPTTLLIPVMIGYLASSGRRQLTKFEMTIVGFVLLSNAAALIFSGSKAGMFLLVLYGSSYLMFRYGNFKTNIFLVVFFTIAVFLLILASVLMATMIRYSGESARPVFEILQDLLFKDDFLLFMVDRITFRLNGYDGTIAVLMNPNPGFLHFANWGTMLSQAAAQLLPGVSFDNLSIGQAVGVYFSGKEEEADHAGALGLIAMFHFMHGWILGPIVIMLIGILFGSLFGILANICKKGSPERSTVFLVISYLMAFWLSSGNIDKLLQALIISIVHMLFYYFLLTFLPLSRQTVGRVAQGRA